MTLNKVPTREGARLYRFKHQDHSGERIEKLVRWRVVAMVILTMASASSDVVGEVTIQARRDASVEANGGFVGDQVRGIAAVDRPMIDAHSTATIERSLALIRSTLPPQKLVHFNDGLQFFGELDFASRNTEVLHELIEGGCDRLVEYRKSPEALRLGLSADAINGLSADAVIVLGQISGNTTNINDFLDWEIDC